MEIMKTKITNKCNNRTDYLQHVNSCELKDTRNFIKILMTNGKMRLKWQATGGINTKVAGTVGELTQNSLSTVF